MNASKLAASAGIVLLVAGLTVLSVLALLQMGVFAYTGGGRLIQIINLVYHYLGYSVLFFIPTFLGYSLFSWLLWSNLTRFNHGPSVDLADNVRYYSVGVDLFITLFFAIGVLFTAWGMQNALVNTLGNVSRDEAGRMGAWGILRGLVNNGILIALWTTIVGGAGGYLMRISKYLFLGRKLNRFVSNIRESDKELLLGSLEAIRLQVAGLESKKSLPPEGGTDVYT